MSCWLRSDITVSFADQTIKAHKFVLAARGDHWSSRDLNEISQLELSGQLVNGKEHRDTHLSPNSDLSQISHCSIKGLSVREIMRIENMITQVKFS